MGVGRPAQETPDAPTTRIPAVPAHARATGAPERSRPCRPGTREVGASPCHHLPTRLLPRQYLGGSREVRARDRVQDRRTARSPQPSWAAHHHSAAPSCLIVHRQPSVPQRAWRPARLPTRPGPRLTSAGTTAAVSSHLLPSAPPWNAQLRAARRAVPAYGRPLCGAQLTSGVSLSRR